MRGPGLALALLALVAAFTFAEPDFASVANLRTIADGSAVGVVLAVGMTFVIRQGSIDLSVEGLMAACSLAFALAVANDRGGGGGAGLGWSALLLAAAVGAVFGLANGLAVTCLRVPSFMATLGWGSIGLGTALLLSGERPPLIRDAALRQWALGQTLGIPDLALVAAACVLAGWFVERHTRFGRHGYAVGFDEELARAAGVDVARCKVAAFACAGLLAGLAAAMESARLGIGHVAIGAGQMLATLSAVVVGGTSLRGGSGSVLGAAAGVLILGVLANGLVFVGAPAYLEKALHGAIVLVAAALAGWRLRDRLEVVK